MTEPLVKNKPVTEVVNSYCLNLHENYMKNEWGPWEVARELYSNAKDADPLHMAVDSIDAHTLIIKTKTLPKLSELFVIGCGSKTIKGGTIGQFGEGLKMAALTTARSYDSSLIFYLPSQTITFSIEDHMGERVLFAHIKEITNSDEYKCELKMPGVGCILNGRIIDGTESRIIKKDKGERVRIFCKGIFICEIPAQHSLFSYNLNSLSINRDRSMADGWEIRRNVGKLLLNKLDKDIAQQLFENIEAWESSECLGEVVFYATDRHKEELAKFWKELYGEYAVIHTCIKASSKATERGYKCKSVTKSIQSLLSGYIKTDIECIPKDAELEPVEKISNEHMEMIEELVEIAQLLDFDSLNIRLFKDNGKLLGQAVPQFRLIWLSESLMHKDNRFERIRTFLHELGHIHGGGYDMTGEFERSLDFMLAKSVIKLLDMERGYGM